MVDQESSAGDLDATVRRLEGLRAQGQSVPLYAQEALRSCLRSLGAEQAGIRNRISQLLNPWGIEVIELTDAELGEHYTIQAEDNYGRLPDRGLSVSMLRFDATHGYYVIPDVGPIR